MQLGANEYTGHIYYCCMKGRKNPVLPLPLDLVFSFLSLSLSRALLSYMILEMKEMLLLTSEEV